MQTNPQLELVYDYVTTTDKNIFLTGKAGTGKTTFLHRIKQEAVKRMAVVAPTGVAAINAGGMTIHSLFQLPFGPMVPGAKIDDRQRRFNKKKIALLRSLDLLVIDEISMVRADLLDGIDGVLRRFRGTSEPFGGVQLLMIGDLNQLPPVVKQEEWRLLSDHYRTPYFFGSLALQKTDPVTIELKHIYRQNDQKFIRLLNKVRDNEMDAEVLDALNSRYRKDFQPTKEEGYITLTSHNAAAQSINQEKLRALEAESKKFKARIDGDFPAHAFPTDEELELKVGAQVMFVKNDPNQEKLFFNGKIGQIMRFGDDAIYVKCPDDAEEIAVTALEWNNTKYNLNERTKEVEADVKGTFTQYPLKLAWAITIHKSQGLTFERAIIDAEAAFAHGQVYVALSRCKSFEGMVLRSKISYASVKTDTVVKNYNVEAEKNAPDEESLAKSKREFQKKLVLELFSFADIQRHIGLANRVLFEQSGAFQGAAFSKLNELKEKADAEVFTVAQKFEPQLWNYLQQPDLPEANDALQTRLKKACAYFFEKIDQAILPLAKDIHVISDNQEAKKKAYERIDGLRKAIFVKHACLKASMDGLDAHKYLRARANADLDFAASRSRPGSRSAKVMPKDTPHPELYHRLARWRSEVAEREDLSGYEVLNLRSLVELTRHLPMSTATLKKIHGIGDTKIARFGGPLLDLIAQYVKEKNIATDQLDLDPNASLAKDDTKRISFDMFQAGNSIAEIAQKRGFVKGTIEGHLLFFIKLGKLDVGKILPKEKVEEIRSFYEKEESRSSTLGREHFGEKYSYNEIRMVLAGMK